MHPATFDSPATFASLVREQVSAAPQASGIGGGNVAVVRTMRLWLCPNCSARITARGFGFFIGWSAPEGRDHGRQCIGGCSTFFHALKPETIKR